MKKQQKMFTKGLLQKTLSKLVIVLILVAFGNDYCFGQSKSGFIANLDFNKAIISVNALKVNTKNTLGASLGLFKEFEKNNNFFIRTQAQLSYKNIDFDVYNQGQSPSLDYFRIETPILLLYKIDVNYDKIYFGFGPAVGFNIFGKYSNGDNLTIGGDYEDMKPIDVGLLFVGGYEIVDKNTFLNISYNACLSSIINANGNFDTKLATVGISIGHYFNR